MDGSGLLTRTVLRSPVIRWILPATLRDEQKHDLIFVGDRVIHIKEISKDGTINHIATKADFDCNILAAKVIAPPAAQEPAFSSERFIGIPPHMIVLALSNNTIQFITVKDEDHTGIQFQVATQPLVVMTDELGSPGRLIAVDPNCRVVAVAAHEKVIQIFQLSYTREDSHLSSSFLESCNVINYDGTIIRMEFLYPSESALGDTILAVLSRKNARFHINIYEWNPNIGISSFKSNILPLGREHSMTSLFIPLQLPGSFLIVDERVIALYSNAHVGNIQQQHCISSRVSSEHSGQSRAFPCWTNCARPSRSSELAFSFKDYLYLARDDGVIYHITVNQNQILNDGEVGRLPCTIDTAFATVPFGRKHGAIIAGGDQCHGYILHVEEATKYPSPFQSGGPLDLQTMDIFQNWTSCRGIVAIDSIKLNELENMRGPAQLFSSRTESLYSNKRLFTINGQSPYGKVSELQYGFELVCKTYHSENHEQGIISLHTVRMTSPEIALLIFSRPWESTLAYCHGSSISEEYWISESPTLAVASLGRAPEALGSSIGGHARDLEIVVHVTSSQIKLHYVEGDSPPIEGEALEVGGITAAAIDYDRFMILITTRAVVGGHVSAKRVVVSNSGCSFEDIGEKLDLDSAGMCVSNFQLFSTEKDSLNGVTNQGHRFTVFGTSSGHLSFVRVDDSAGLLPVNLHSQEGIVINDDSKGPCEKIISLNPALDIDEDSSQIFTVLLCTYRHGYVRSVSLEYDKTANTLRMTGDHYFSIGVMPAMIEPDQSNRGAAFIWSGNKICYANYNNTTTKRPRIHAIHLTSHLTDPHYEDRTLLDHGNIDALTQIPSDAAKTSRSGLLIIASRIFGSSGLATGYLSNQPKPLLRDIRIPGTPTSITYSEEFDLLIIASTCSTLDDSTGRRYLLSKIFTVKPDLQTAYGPADGRGQAQEVRLIYELKVGESVNDMLEWKLTLKNQEYLFLVIATSVINARGREWGYIRWAKVKPDGQGGFSFHKVEESWEDYPVQKLCIYKPAPLEFRSSDPASPGSRSIDSKSTNSSIPDKTSFKWTSLLYCCGNEVKRRYLSTEKMKFGKEVLQKVSSRILHITAESPNYFLITTAEHSVQSHKTQYYPEVYPTLYEQQARLGLCHIELSRSRLVLVSGKNKDLAALIHDDTEGPLEKDHVSPCMEAKLQHSMKYLVEANLRPPWKSSKPPGIMRRNILGMSVDGALYEISILSDKCLQLLDFVQNLCLNEVKICGHQKPRSKRKFHRAQAAQSPATKNHIDADIITRLVEQGNAVGLLNHMLDSDASEYEDMMELDDQHVSQLRSRLYNLVDEVVHFEGEGDESNFQCGLRYPRDSSDPCLAKFTLAYLRDIVDIPL